MPFIKFAQLWAEKSQVAAETEAERQHTPLYIVQEWEDILFRAEGVSHAN